MPKIKKLLVANRSEIAIRIFRAANELGVKTVAIWAEEDKYALHRFKADESYQVGRGPHLAKEMGPIESYLSIEEVIRVAKLSGADAIHPGYGLLSESPEFAEACAALLVMSSIAWAFISGSSSSASTSRPLVIAPTGLMTS